MLSLGQAFSQLLGAQFPSVPEALLQDFQAGGQDKDERGSRKTFLQSFGPSDVYVEDHPITLSQTLGHIIPGTALEIAELLHPLQEGTLVPEPVKLLGGDEKILPTEGLLGAGRTGSIRNGKA